MGRKFARKLLIIAVVLSVLVSIYDFISMSGPNYWVLIRIILPTLLLSVALKYPTMAYSNIFAGTGAFSSVAVLSMYLLRLLERLNTSIYDSTVVLAIICFLCLYFAYISAGEAVGWITELRIKQKDLDTDEGMDKMTKEFIKFLSPRTTFLMALVLFFAIFVLVLFVGTLLDMRRQGRLSNPYGIVGIIIIIILMQVWMIIKTKKGYRHYIKDLSSTGKLSQAVLDYYKGSNYLDGQVVLGQQYIFVEGASRIYEYDSLERMYFVRKSYKGVKSWRIMAVNKDGTIINLFSLEDDKEYYLKYVLPILDAIKHRNPDVLIEEPKELAK